MLKGKPIPFILVFAIAIALTVFFGAWAVSADLYARNPAFAPGLGLYGGAVGDESGLENTASQNSSTPLIEGEVSEEAPWWQSALLTACPLH